MVDLPPAPELNLFCETLPSLPRAWDSTMLGLLKECPKKFEYIILKGYSPTGFAAHLEFGIAYHKALETFDKDRFAGAGYEEAVRNSVMFCLSYGYRDDKDKFHQFDAMYTNEPAKTRDTLLRSVVWYLETFRNEPVKTVELRDGTPAVELSFKLNLDLETPDGHPFILCGHLDRVIDDDGDYLISDRKTTKGAITPRYWQQFNPNNQMSLYYTAGQLVLNKPIKGIIIDAAELGVNYTRFKRQLITRDASLQAEWLRDTYTWIGMAIQFATDNHWPMNDKSCGNYGGCAFQKLCSRSPKTRDLFLKDGAFIHRQWNPLISRVIPWLIPLLSLQCFPIFQ